MWGIRRAGHRLASAVLAAVALCGTATAPVGATADGPVLDRDFPDPDVVEVDGTYHAYATNSSGRNVTRATSRDLTHWTVHDADALPVLGSWAVAEPRGRVWAPEVFDNGTGLTMLYTARDRASDRQCIGVALSPTPDGPFRPTGDGPLICPATEGGAIDAASHSEGGQRYVLWKNDGNCCGRDTWIHLQRTSRDGTRLTGEPIRLIGRDRDWEGDLVEAPTLVKRRDGGYLLLYSAHSYAGDAYATGYAVADRLTGPYTKAAAPLMTTASFDGTVRGPGGQDVVTGPDGRDRILFHGWSADRTRRALYAADLGYADGRPVVRGSRVSHQAEDAQVHRAVVREADRARGGRAVGHLDHPDSHVEFRVFAASAGPHALSVRFGNGSLDASGAPAGASHLLTVNGVASGAVDYPHTGWDHWQEAGTTITLRDGWNTVRLSKGERYAELDAVDVA
ncbi:family 43 glycosylhydrolase [Streptomyces sp. NPDC058171]